METTMVPITELEQTANLMVSADYKDRFRAEYAQVKIRMKKLKSMLNKWDSGDLDFTPTCPMDIYNSQIKAMTDYCIVLEARASMEGIIL